MQPHATSCHLPTKIGLFSHIKPPTLTMLLRARKLCFSPGSCRNLSRIFGENTGVIDIAEEVKFALHYNRPVVALESTIVTHGMPFPKNAECARGVEEVVRKQGAIPATIGIIDGRIKVGLDSNELSKLADTVKSSPIKTSRRDFPYVVAQKLNGGTTVSGTLVVANKVGIPVFATGGLGGVHRKGETTFDVSADLTELGKCGVAVVSSGIKSILDIPKTLEYLETQGVFVAVFGSSKEFPAFYCRKSGSKVPYNVVSAEEAAEVIRASKTVELKSGLLFAVPIPEEYAMEEEEMERVIEEALAGAERCGVGGKELTPYILERVTAATSGRSLQSNVALIKNNARVASDIAVELAKLNGGCGGVEPTEGQPFIVGGSNLDICAKLREPHIQLDGRLHFAKFSRTAGGVARNICEAMGKLGCQPNFLTVVGDDEYGHFLKSTLPPESLKTALMLPEQNTAQCTIVLDAQGDCTFLVGDMSIHEKITPEVVSQYENHISRSPLVILDSNISTKTMSTALTIAKKHNVPVFYEPTDASVATKPFEEPSWTAIKYITPNLNELKIIASVFNIYLPPKITGNINQASYLARLVQEHIPVIIVTLGAQGLVIANKNSAAEPLLPVQESSSNVEVRHYPVVEEKNVVNVSGAGDCFASGLIAGMLRGFNEENCVSFGFAAARASLYSTNTVPNNLLSKCEALWKEPAKYVLL